MSKTFKEFIKDQSKELKHCDNIYFDGIQYIEKLEAQNKIMREALEYYRDETTDIIAVRAKRSLEELENNESN